MAGEGRGPVRRIAFATYSVLPQGSPDDQPALESLRARGVEATAEVWDSPDVDWTRFDAVILRSTWDYHRQLGNYLEWLRRVQETSRLWNPLETVRWNSHKSYLVDLAEKGLAVVPTELLRQGSTVSLRSVCEARGWSDIAVKPAVGANAYRFLRASRDDLTAGEAHLRALLHDGDALVQPFLPLATVRGERSLVFVDGQFSHAVRYGVVLDQPNREPVAIAPDRWDLDEGARVLASLPSPPLYARLDYLPEDAGTWKLGELELIEPELFFQTAPGAADRFAAAILRRLGA